MPGALPWATSPATTSGHLQPCWRPRPVAKSVTHVAGQKCYLCRRTEPLDPGRAWSVVLGRTRLGRGRSLPRTKGRRTTMDEGRTKNQGRRTKDTLLHGSENSGYRIGGGGSLVSPSSIVNVYSSEYHGGSRSGWSDRGSSWRTRLPIRFRVTPNCTSSSRCSSSGM